ncbi:hypothetical protein [Tenacibaculum maritimum]|uniref:hypothetical protein n=1 Tax=Tenacibaculum maritimum TaxID=107401 RepID=UPI001E48F4F9|nr:hypothetical protein [Tenacibaculum maritimum]MCD9583944.1 hypothetical protein [Tenacibaculum maritimum]MCD9621676.1 hypothetical protein [Tenacibaculum maritimum]MCD9627925.1 hypothetical protein [Tenacibaculum maritimum]MCD9630627.1 hypothetical protein [Tenacibaculum maritimum]MCD9633990.1 hypothetical protein [Tenacibaculum maritimum]
MNNYFTILLLFLFITCKTVKRTIIITQKETILPVYALLSNDTQRIIRLCFPIKVNLKNTSSSEQSFIKVNYEYNSIPRELAYGVSLFKKKKASLIRISNNQKKGIPSYSSKEYILYTRHFVDSISSIQQQFKPYINQMLTTNKDTLHIGTVTEFQQKHPKLFQQLTKNDRISIQFLEGKKLGKPISIPVTW